MVGYNLVERPKKYFGLGLPNVDLNQLKGKLITIEGTDGWAAPLKSNC